MFIEQVVEPTFGLGDVDRIDLVLSSGDGGRFDSRCRVTDAHTGMGGRDRRRARRHLVKPFLDGRAIASPWCPCAGCR